MVRFVALLVVAAFLAAPADSSATDQPIAGKKLLIKRSGSGAEKLVWISKDPAFLFPALGGADDPAETAGAVVDIFSENEVADGQLTMPAGLGNPGWMKKDASIDLYKFVNPSSPAGISVVKVALLKQGKLLKIVAKATGLALTGTQGSVGIRLTTGTLRSCAIFSAANGTIVKDEADRFIAKDASTLGVPDCGDATLGGGVGTTTTTSATSTSTSGPTTTTSTTLADWGLSCFASGDCGPSFCPANGLQCTDFIQSVGLMGGLEMCFFDCMDGTGFGSFEDVTDCRDGCAGGPIPPPPCDTSVAGGGGFSGVVTGPGACTPSGFAATVTYGGTAGELKRVLVDFATAIDESTLFSAPPPPCSGTCPAPSSACDGGAPYSAVPLPAHFRLQIGTPGLPAEVCDRSGVPATVCKYSATGYAFIFSLPPPMTSGIDLTGAPIDVTLFLSCHIESSGGGTFLHFSTGDFYATGTF
jgi:hypothetical protein